MKTQQSNIRIICFLNISNFYYCIDKLKNNYLLNLNYIIHKVIEIKNKM